MALISVLGKKSLSENLRLDAEYYSKPLLSLLSSIERFQVKTVEELCSVESGVTPKYSNEGTEVIRSGDLSYDEFVNLDGLLRTKETQTFKVQQKDVLISSIGLGSIGKVCVYDEETERATVSEVLVLRKCKVNPFYLCAFLRGKFGQYQINREITGATGQLHLLKSNVKKIIIPLIKGIEKNIESKFVEAKKNYVNSENMFEEAQEKLLKSLDFKLRLPEKSDYLANFSDALKHKRFDAEFFKPKYNKLIEWIKNGEHTRLTDLVDVVKSETEPRKTPDRKFKYIELSDIDSSVGTIRNHTLLLGKDAPSRARMSLKEGDVIVSSVKGSLDKVALVSKDYNGSVGSTGFFVLRPKNILSGCLLALSKSPILQLQLERESSGTILTAVPKESIKNIIVPKIKPQTQKEIHKLIIDSHKLRESSKRLLEEAKLKIENTIENN